MPMHLSCNFDIKGADYALDSTDIKEKLEDLLLNSHVIVKMSSTNSSTAKGMFHETELYKLFDIYTG